MPILSHAGTFSVMGSTRIVTVATVFDGDTFKTTQGEKIRLLGINTPEVAHRDSPAQPWGNQVSDFLKQRLKGQQVRLEIDQEKKDRYQRTLAHVYLKNGTWINGELVRKGMAHVYTFAPNFLYAKELIKLEQEARQDHIGIWTHPRFRVLKSTHIDQQHIGQFRVIYGKISHLKKYRFQLGKIRISIPRKARSYMPRLQLKEGQPLIVRGKIRMSRTKNLFMSLYSPTDLEYPSL